MCIHIHVSWLLNYSILNRRWKIILLLRSITCTKNCPNEILSTLHQSFVLDTNIGSYFWCDGNTTWYNYISTTYWDSHVKENYKNERNEKKQKKRSNKSSAFIVSMMHAFWFTFDYVIWLQSIHVLIYFHHPLNRVYKKKKETLFSFNIRCYIFFFVIVSVVAWR